MLWFTLRNTDVSLATRCAHRRDILVPAMVGFPDAKSTIKMIKNTTRLNNEVLKTRIQCIPVHTKGVAEDVGALQVHVSVKNDTETVMYVTTEHFRGNKGSRGYLPDSVARKMFPQTTRRGCTSTWCASTLLLSRTSCIPTRPRQRAASERSSSSPPTSS